MSEFVLLSKVLLKHKTKRLKIIIEQKLSVSLKHPYQALTYLGFIYNDNIVIIGAYLLTANICLYLSAFFSSVNIGKSRS